MSTSATVAPATKSIWGGGEAPLKATYGKLMMWFFLLSDAFTFSGLLITYGLIRFTFPSNDSGLNGGEFAWDTTKWPVPEEVFEAVPFLHGMELPLVFVGIMTFILILSSVTMVLAVEAGERMDKKAAQKWMLWTLLGGIAFLSCQAWEWSHFITGTGEEVDFWAVINGKAEMIKVTGASLPYNQYGPPAFADLFFFITGFHGFHVFSGVVINFIIFYNIVVGTYQRRGHYEMVEKAGLYWHFVDLVWVFVFTFFYLV